MPFELKNLTQDLQSDDVIKCLFIHMDQRFPLIVNVKSMAKCYKYSGNSCSMFIDNQWFVSQLLQLTDILQTLGRELITSQLLND